MTRRALLRTSLPVVLGLLSLLCAARPAAAQVEGLTTVRLYSSTGELKPKLGGVETIYADLYGETRDQDQLRTQVDLDWWGMPLAVVRFKNDIANFLDDWDAYEKALATGDGFDTAWNFASALGDVGGAYSDFKDGLGFLDEDDQYDAAEGKFEVTYPHPLYNKVQVTFEGRFCDDDIWIFNVSPKLPENQSAIKVFGIYKRGKQAGEPDKVSIDGREYDNVWNQTFEIDLEQLWREQGVKMYADFPLSFVTRTLRDGDNMATRHLLTLRVNPPPRPKVTSFDPVEGLPGKTVVIRGDNLNYRPSNVGATLTKGVRFGLVEAQWSQSADGTISAQVPPSLTGSSLKELELTVTTVGGVDVPCKKYRLFQAPKSVSFVSATLTATPLVRAGETFELRGRFLRDVTSVAFVPTATGAAPEKETSFMEATASVAGETLKVTTPRGAPATSKVRIRTKGGECFSPVVRVVSTDAPAVSGVTQNTTSSGGKTVTLTGSRIDTTSAVYFGAGTCPILSKTATTLTFAPPAGTTTGLVIISTSFGTTAYAEPITVVNGGTSPAPTPGGGTN